MMIRDKVYYNLMIFIFSMLVIVLHMNFILNLIVTCNLILFVSYDMIG